jgi:hypothetical protein
MILLGVLTGETKDELIEVQLHFGMKRMCRPVFAFPFLSAPYKDWVDTYKDKFMGIVTFLNNDKGDNFEEAILIGIMPLPNNSTPQEKLSDGNTILLTKNFRQWIDDQNNKYIIDVLNNGKILLGDKNVTEQAVLGNKAVQFINDLITQINLTLDQCASITVVTPVGNSSPPVNAPAFMAIKAQITLLQQTINTILSNTVKLR